MKNTTEIARVLAVPALNYSRKKLPMHLWDKRIIETKPKDFPSWTPPPKKKPATSINLSIYVPKLMHAMKEKIERENG